jgi:hypothetical protein
VLVLAPSRLQIRSCRCIVGEVRWSSDILVGRRVRSMVLACGLRCADSPQNHHRILTTPRSRCAGGRRVARRRRVRAVYPARFEKAVYVLHAFRKKSPSGIGRPNGMSVLSRSGCRPLRGITRSTMASRNAERREPVTRGTGNVFADLGFPMPRSVRPSCAWLARCIRCSTRASYPKPMPPRCWE